MFLIRNTEEGQKTIGDHLEESDKANITQGHSRFIQLLNSKKGHNRKDIEPMIPLMKGKGKLFHPKTQDLKTQDCLKMCIYLHIIPLCQTLYRIQTRWFAISLRQIRLRCRGRTGHDKEVAGMKKRLAKLQHALGKSETIVVPIKSSRYKLFLRSWRRREGERKQKGNDELQSMVSRK